MGWYLSPTYDSADHRGSICRGACGHQDCAQNRELIASLCEICQKPIGEGRAIYYHDNTSRANHASCADEQHESVFLEEAKI